MQCNFKSDDIQLKNKDCCWNILTVFISDKAEYIHCLLCFFSHVHPQTITNEYTKQHALHLYDPSLLPVPTFTFLMTRAS